MTPVTVSIIDMATRLRRLGRISMLEDFTEPQTS